MKYNLLLLYKKTIFLSKEARQDLDGTCCFTCLNIQFHIFTYIIYLFDFKYFRTSSLMITINYLCLLKVMDIQFGIFQLVRMLAYVSPMYLNLFNVSLLKSLGWLWLSCAASTHDDEVTKQHRRSARQPQQFKHLYRCLTFFLPNRLIFV